MHRVTKTMEAAMRLAAVDFEINGYYANAPYDIKGADGQKLKARIRTHVGNNGSGKEVTYYRLELIQPELVLDNYELPRPILAEMPVEPKRKGD